MKRVLSVLLLAVLLISCVAFLPDVGIQKAVAETTMTEGTMMRSGPSIIDAKALTYDSVRITWEKISGANYYQVHYRQAGQRKYVAAKVNGKQNIKNTNTIIVTGLKPNTLYYFEVRAANSNTYKKMGFYKWTEYSIAKKARTLPAVPAIPSGVRAAYSTSNKSVTVVWNSDSRAMSYEVQYVRSGDSWSSAAAHGTSSSYATITSGLYGGTTMMFRVRACYKSGTSTKYTAWSSVVYVNIPTPSVPSNVKASYDSANKFVTVNWNKDGSAAGYEVQMSQKGLSPWGNSKITSGNSVIYSSGLVAGKTMAFRVRAYWNNGSKTVYTGWSSTVYVDIPGSASVTVSTPTIKVEKYGRGQVKITVTNHSSATTGYEIEWGKSGFLAWLTDGSWPYKTTKTGSSFIISDNLVIGTEFAFHVRAYYYVNGVKKYTNWSSKSYVTPSDGGFSTRYQVVYRGGLYINEKANRLNCDKRLMPKGSYFWVDLSTKTWSGKYYWAKAVYGDYIGWVAISEPSYCVPK